jgi:TolB-like protein
MKKIFFPPVILCLLFLSACASTPAPAETLTLEEAIAAAAADINTGLDRGVKAAVLNFSSPSEGLSDYVIEELSLILAGGRNLVVVDRKELELVRQELNFQLSGEVSDESAQAIGKMLGAQYIVSGSLVNMGKSYRFRVKTIQVETAAIAVSTLVDVRDEKIAFLIGGPKAPPALTPPGENPVNASPKPPAPISPDKVYRIGDTGPAGGMIFFDKGLYEAGWRYLEAAPHDLGPAQWGAYGIDVFGTSKDIGSGKRNTQILIDKFKDWGETGKAAQLCTAFMLNGYQDWFLPSKEELNLLADNLKDRGLGGFTDEWYWSSTQDTEDRAWDQRFYDGYPYSTNRKNAAWVRPIRAF